jgi:hypothetical protein
MAESKKWLFITAGLFVGGVGAGCETPAPGMSMEEAPQRPQAVAAEEQTDAECEALPQVSPQALAAWVYDYDPDYSEFKCGAAVPDGAGGVVMVRGVGGNSYNSLSLFLGRDNGWVTGTSYSAFNFTPASQSGGVLGFSTPVGGGHPWLTYLDTTLMTLTHHPPEAAPVLMTSVDPAGGLRAFLADGTLKAYSATGESLWSVPVSLSAPLKALGVDAQGHTLVLAGGNTRFGASTAEGVWVDSSGQPTPPFLALASAPGSAASYELTPQAEQGLFLSIQEGISQSWAAAFASLEPSSSPAPTWLAQGAQRTLFRLPSGRGYLRLSQDCAPQGELITASGLTCSTFSFPSIAGPGCGSLRLGMDGTVVESLPPTQHRYGEMGDSYIELVCRARWWPALLQ